MLVMSETKLTKTKIKSSAMLLVAAFFWGTTFVAQDVAAGSIGPFSYNALRSLVAVIFLSAVIPIFDKTGHYTKKPLTYADKTLLLKGGILVGLIFTFSSYMQQRGLIYTTAGKAAFVTAFYLILVPVVGIFMGRKSPITVWIAIFVSLAGLYFLCIDESLNIGSGELLVFICSIGYTGHIIAVGYYSRMCDGFRLSRIQFAAAFIANGILALLFEDTTYEVILINLIPILFAGIFSSGIAFTLQILAQANLNAAVASILMSCESLFGVLSGAIILKETMNQREILGCVLMFAAILLSQLPDSSKKTG